MDLDSDWYYFATFKWIMVSQGDFFHRFRISGKIPRGQMKHVKNIETEELQVILIDMKGSHP